MLKLVILYPEPPESSKFSRRHLKCKALLPPRLALHGGCSQAEILQNFRDEMLQVFVNGSVGVN